jgi:hypothetical protein
MLGFNCSAYDSRGLQHSVNMLNLVEYSTAQNSGSTFQISNLKFQISNIKFSGPGIAEILSLISKA